MKEIYLAGGCFWGMQRYLGLISGIISTETGFANGNPGIVNPSYELVYSDTTGFAETVRVEYDPSVTDLPFLLDMFFRAIDPTSLNKQGNDCGTRYRTGVYYTDPADRYVIEAFIGILRDKYADPIVTECTPLQNYFRAGEYHQDYLDKNPGGYCHIPLDMFSFARKARPASKKDRYETAFQKTADLVSRKSGDDLLTSICTMLEAEMGFLWTGFYYVKDRQLVLGPNFGPPACEMIRKGRGVCGTAYEQAKTIIVPDVEDFAGHIACSSLSRSEIVIPVFDKTGSVSSIFDVDSASLSFFDQTDADGLSRILSLLS